MRELEYQLKGKYNQIVDLNICEIPKQPDGRKAHLILYNIVIKEKNNGYGSKILADIVNYANENDLIVSLYPVSQKGRTKKQNKRNQMRIESFYERFGFKKEKSKYTGSFLYYPKN
jgi:hypothetical protein